MFESHPRALPLSTSSLIKQDLLQLIALSFISLRQSLEVIRAEHRMREFTFNNYDNRHPCCNQLSPICQISYVASLNASLAQYIDQLSQVYFKKENLRGRTWRIPVFYSLVIQSIVRQLLLKLVDYLLDPPSSIKQCLHLAVRLFIASSDGYDPLAREWDTSNPLLSQEEIEQIKTYEAAKVSVQEKDWKSLGYQNSSDYLRILFEDDESPLYEVNSSSVEFSTDELLYELASQKNLLYATSLTVGTLEHQDFASSDKVAITRKPPYQRPKHERIKCKLCDHLPEGFRGEHELRRHMDREHRTVVNKWLCVEPEDSLDHAVPVVPLSKCKACHQNKQYNVYYNAAAHLRRAHFKPKKLARTKNNANVEDGNNRGGKGGGDWPPMSELKYWMKEVDSVEVEEEVIAVMDV
jgi:hypothetical protein